VPFQTLLCFSSQGADYSDVRQEGFPHFRMFRLFRSKQGEPRPGEHHMYFKHLLDDHRPDQLQYCTYCILNDFLLFFPSQVSQPRHSMTAADCRMWKTAQGKATDILQQAMVDSQRLRETKEPGKGNGHSRSTYGMHKLSAYGTLSQGGRAKSLLVKASPLAESLLANAPNRR
jgi:hypothetical protein